MLNQINSAYKWTINSFLAENIVDIMKAIEQCFYSKLWNLTAISVTKLSIGDLWSGKLLSSQSFFSLNVEHVKGLESRHAIHCLNSWGMKRGRFVTPSGRHVIY